MPEDMQWETAVRLAALHEKEESIGELAEKTLHSVLKYYFCDDVSCHEIKFNGYVADIFEERGTNKPLITEIQTKQAFRLAKKLVAYGDAAEIRIVLPVVNNKRIITKNKATGELISKRVSPKHSNIYNALAELYGLREYINKENITIYIMLVNAVEYRFFEANIAKKRKLYEKDDIVPTEILDTVVLKDCLDYSILVPFDKGTSFTAETFAEKTNVALTEARKALLTLKTVTAVEENGRQGRKKLWKRR